jgi:plastocyanin
MVHRFLIPSLVLITTVIANSVVDFNVVWDGGDTLPETTILVGDSVIWTRQDSGPFILSGSDFTATMDGGAYSYTFMVPGDYFYAVATGGGDSAGGVVKVKEARYFDQAVDYYHLKIGDILRWSWEGETPELPTDFNGFCPHPGISNTGPNHLDWTFLIPGEYSWYDNIDHEYKINVEDQFTEKHLNIPWNSDFVYGTTFEVGYVLRFYVTDAQKHNVRVVHANEDGSPMDPNTALWVSDDIEHPGESVYYVPNPGSYVATSDYDTNTMMSFIVNYPPPKDDKKEGGILPKSVVYVAEVSLFMIGLLGLGNMIRDQFDMGDKKDKKDDSPPGGDGGGVTDYALHRSKQRIAAATAAQH